MRCRKFLKLRSFKFGRNHAIFCCCAYQIFRSSRKAQIILHKMILKSIKVIAKSHRMAGNLITVKYSEDDGKLKRGATSSKSRRFWVGGIPEDKLTKKEIVIFLFNICFNHQCLLKNQMEYVLRLSLCQFFFFEFLIRLRISKNF